MEPYVALKPVYTFQYWWYLSRCASCQIHRYKCTPIPSEMHLYFNWTSWIISPLFRKASLNSISNFNLSDHSFHFCLSPFQSAVVQRIRHIFWTMFIYSFFFECCICGWRGELSSQTTHFFKVFQSPCSDFHDRIIPVFNAVPSESLKKGIQYWFSAVSLVHRMSPFAQNLLQILCTVDEGIIMIIFTSLR